MTTVLPCGNCGKPFTPKREHARFCKPSCRAEAHREAHRASRAAATREKPAVPVLARHPGGIQVAHRKAQRAARRVALQAYSAALGGFRFEMTRADTLVDRELSPAQRARLKARS